MNKNNTFNKGRKALANHGQSSGSSVIIDSSCSSWKSGALLRGQDFIKGFFYFCPDYSPNISMSVPCAVVPLPPPKGLLQPGVYPLPVLSGPPKRLRRRLPWRPSRNLKSRKNPQNLGRIRCFIKSSYYLLKESKENFNMYTGYINSI